MIGSNIRWTLVVKCVWLGAGLSFWQIGLGNCIAEPSCWFALETMEHILCVMSFPSGVLFLLVSQVFIAVGLSIHVEALPIRYTFESLGMLGAGYLQWFHIVPALFGNQKLTLLSLTHATPSRPLDKETPSRRVRRTQARTARIQPFDKAGRTPLERAIR